MSADVVGMKNPTRRCRDGVFIGEVPVMVCTNTTLPGWCAATRTTGSSTRPAIRWPSRGLAALAEGLAYYVLIDTVAPTAAHHQVHAAIAAVYDR